jgi:hypothetical protein
VGEGRGKEGGRGKFEREGAGVEMGESVFGRVNLFGRGLLMTAKVDGAAAESKGGTESGKVGRAEGEEFEAVLALMYRV